MDLAGVCLIALVAVLLLSCLTSVNVGLLAIGAAWLIGVYVAPEFGHTIGVKGVIGGFPIDLFLTLTGTTLLFAAAHSNGTLAALVDRGVRMCRGRAALIPVALFLLAFGIAALGAGNIAAVALIAPSAMAIADRLRIAPMRMALAVGHGSIAGALTPVSPIGIIAASKLQAIGLADAAWPIFFLNFAANAVVAAIGYFLFRHDSREHSIPVENPSEAAPIVPFLRQHVITLAVVGAVFGCVIFGKAHLGLASFTAAGVLLVVRAANERATFRAVPWSVVIMVCGVSMLVALAETTGALDLFTRLLARLANQQTIVGWLALVTGCVSIFSSTSGVVLPTFIPMVPGFVREVGGDPRNMAIAIVIGSNLVDVSPLSTIGALCVAAASAVAPSRQLFNRMLLWGFAMAPVAAVVCQVAVWCM